MNRDSGSERPSQRTVAELLAEYGGSSSNNARKRRRRAEDPADTAPQAIIERVLSDSGRMRPVASDEQAPQSPGANAQAPRAPGLPAEGGPASSTPAARLPAAHPANPTPPAPALQPQNTEESATPPDSQGSTPGAQRFAAASSTPPAQQPTQQGGQDEHGSDRAHPGVAAQQPALGRPTPYPRPHSSQPQVCQAPQELPAAPPNAQAEVGAATEQLPLVQAEKRQLRGGSTALFAYSQGAEATGGARAQEPYGADPYAEPGDGSHGNHERTGGNDHVSELPAGMAFEDYHDQGSRDADEAESSPGKEWFVLAGQGFLGLLAGGVVWLGFRWLWNGFPPAALGAALVITGSLVFIARKFLRTDDLQTILLAVLVGLICTVSPAALLLVGH